MEPMITKGDESLPSTLTHATPYPGLGWELHTLGHQLMTFSERLLRMWESTPAGPHLSLTPSPGTLLAQRNAKVGGVV